jgi:hypothetical protein
VSTLFCFSRTFARIASFGRSPQILTVCYLQRLFPLDLGAAMEWSISGDHRMETERSGLLMHPATTESVSLCAPMKN